MSGYLLLFAIVAAFIVFSVLTEHLLGVFILKVLRRLGMFSKPNESSSKRDSLFEKDID